ncbi:oligosaccharide flippase family protein [Serratia fonticola]|uniref:flippase n=1 Tax=Serratia fonticola TaxID=47917 RepID=UPI001376C74F|nr:flippase [Serratia fonticola]NBJ33774.1 oligosaccharide flippase family protein [Serratia fonticola]
MGIYLRLSKNKSVLNMLWLSGDSIFRMGLGFVVSVWLARYLGPENFGLFNYALAIIAIYTSVASLGMNGVVVRELIQHPENAGRVMGTSFILQVLGSISASIFVILTTLALRPNENNVLIVVLVMIPSILLRSTDIIKYWFESIIASKNTVIAQNSAFIISCFIKIIIILCGGSYVVLACTVSLEALIVAIMLVFLFKRKKINLKWESNISEAKRLFKQSWPLVLSGLALMLYMRIDQIMIGNLVNNTAVGIYSVAVKMIEVWYFFPIAIVSSLFPKIIQEKSKNEEKYNEKMQFLYDVMVVLGVLLAIFVTCISDYIIEFFYGVQYYEAASLIKIYSWVSIFYFLSSASGRWYINEGLQMYAFTRNIFGLIICFALNYLFIPLYGLSGSAIATLIAYFCAAYLFDAFHKKTRISFFQKSKSLWVPGAIVRIGIYFKGK